MPGQRHKAYRRPSLRSGWRPLMDRVQGGRRDHDDGAGRLRTLVGVPVVMVVGVFRGVLERRRGGAAVGGLTTADLELDGGVGDAESLAQGAVDGVENTGALGERHLGDEDVAGESVGGRTE